jgi:hypothetical protein
MKITRKKRRNEKKRTRKKKKKDEMRTRLLEKFESPNSEDWRSNGPITEHTRLAICIAESSYG